ncbi:MAG: alpha-L-arabinofuranosidase [Lachnospiraceae bacterium]|nr:alpha-L-arabinofuranosidase [Lachnospiraceae bacterium]
MKQITIFQNQNYKELGILYGLFFEDINHAADGGLYAEMVQNRSFEYCETDKKEYHALTAWEKTGAVRWEVRTEQPMHAEKPHYLHVESQPGGAVCNMGYNTGFFVEAGKGYDFSMYAGGAEGNVSVRVTVEEEGAVCAEGRLAVSGSAWRKYELQMKASQTTTCGRLVLTFEAGGTCNLDMISFFPQDTFLGKKGGLRKDIAEALQEMHPKFMRFPGGCLVHDGSLNDHDRNSMYRWKRTLGKVEERPTWRSNWGYNQSLGLGYFEYFCFCEEIGAEPVPILPGGFNPHKGVGVPLAEIGEWVDDALDLIEFANGSSDTVWGKIRKELGHEAPFYLKYIGIGNEEVGDGFFERYPYFHEAIREKYPEIKIINTAGPFASGESYEAGWRSAKKCGSDLVDEHYYSAPEWFLANMHHYEDYDENGPKVFLGEYASWGNTYYNALVEAAYMTHLERSKAVEMACYAPMLCNVDYVNWKPDMLWFNNHAILKTPNYYVQKLFMQNQGTDAVAFETASLDEVIPLVDEKAITGNFAIAGNDIEGRIWDVKVTDLNTGDVTKLRDISIGKDNLENQLMDISGSHYKISFRFQRTAGRKGLKIYFGEKDRKNRFIWEFGGWDNWDCNLTSCRAGRDSCISQRLFHVEDIAYFLELEVEDRRIRTWVNGALSNDTVDRLPELEELYVTASVDRGSDKTILKVVNLTGEEKDVRLILDGASKNSVTVTSLKGYGLDETNSFECPDNITPQTEHFPVSGNELSYTFMPHSVTVLSFENGGL